MLNKILSNKKNTHLLVALYLLVLIFFLYYFTQPKTENPFNYFIYLADAFIHGRLDVIDTPFYFEELIEWQDKFFTIYPPMPAVILTPFVALFGMSFSQVLASVILGAFNVSIFYLLMKRLTDKEDIQIWMTLLFGFGTIHWYTSTIGSVWYFAQIVSLFFMLLAIYETFGRRNLFVIGLLLGASYWSRIPTVLSLPFFLIILSDSWFPQIKEGVLIKRVQFKPLILLGSGIAVFILLNFLYNYLRFGTPMDTAYSLHTISSAKNVVSPWFDKGLFSLSYVKHHLYVFLLHPPVVTDSWPYIVPSMVGLSVLITTPAFILVLFAGIRNKFSIACWVAILPIAFLIFLKSGTGWTQFGYRYALDFYPFLLLLTLKGIGDKLRWYHKLLIGISILVNIWGVFFINKFEWYKLY